MLKKYYILFLIFFIVISGCNQNRTSETDEQQSLEQAEEEEPQSQKASNQMEGIVYFDSPVIRFISAPSGLSLRKAPNASAEKITVIPFGTKISVYRQTKETESVNDSELGRKITDQWLFIQGEKWEGWVFGGYTSLMKTTEIDHALMLLAEKPFKNRPNFNAFSENDVIKDGKPTSVIEKKFGPVQKVDTEKVQNRHDNEQYDDLVTLFFEHFKCIMYVTKERQLPLGFTITSDAIPLQHGITLGVSRQKIKELFGKPGRAADDFIAYEPTSEYPPALKFSFEDNKLQSITVNYYFD
ncbi:MAG: SH3 domain-containing protein [Spirochaetes bacterium]|jgi:hypothetical protein|nr:SH3 domain-containing protein [Spirochaetota bacterium]